MHIRFIVNMGSKFQIGDKVTWTVGKFTCKGLYLESVDAEFSLIQCYERNDKRCVTQLQVLTSLLNGDFS